MRFLVCADVEGASGVGSDSMLSGDSFQQVRELITGDVNACARGIHRAAPDAKIDLFDAHGLGGNILEANLDQGVSLLGGGWIDTLFPLVSEGRLGTYDGLFLVGQHAANGTRNGFISHTNSEFAALRVNDRDAGEAEQLAWLAGAHSVPTLLVVGDDATGREVNALLLGVRTVSVKTALDRKRLSADPLKMRGRRSNRPPQKPHLPRRVPRRAPSPSRSGSSSTSHTQMSPPLRRPSEASLLRQKAPCDSSERRSWMPGSTTRRLLAHAQSSSCTRKPSGASTRNLMAHRRSPHS